MKYYLINDHIIDLNDIQYVKLVSRETGDKLPIHINIKFKNQDDILKIECIATRRTEIRRASIYHSVYQNHLCAEEAFQVLIELLVNNKDMLKVLKEDRDNRVSKRKVKKVSILNND